MIAILILVFSIFILIGLIGIMFKLDYIIKELEKLTGGEGGFTGGKKTFRERLKEVQKKRNSFECLYKENENCKHSINNISSTIPCYECDWYRIQRLEKFKL